MDLRALRALAYDGVPDSERGLRAAVWRLLLGLLPPERAQWERALRRKRAEYAQFCEVGGWRGARSASCMLQACVRRCSLLSCFEAIRPTRGCAAAPWRAAGLLKLMQPAACAPSALCDC